VTTSPEKNGRVARYAGIVVAVLVWVGIGIYQFSTMDRTPFFGDESQWIAKAGGWFLLRAGEFDDPYWDYEALDQPLFIPYVFGAVAEAGGRDVTALNAMYDFEKDYATNLKEGRVPNNALRRRCRTVSTAFGLLGCAAGMAVGWRLAGPVGGIAAGLLLGFNPLYVRSAHRAMAEGALSLWFLTGWLLCMSYAEALRGRKIRRMWVLAVCAGLVGGLGAMTKLNAGAILVGLVGVGLAHFWREVLKGNAGAGIRPLFHTVLTTGAACAIGYLVFIAQSPLTWREPVNGPRGMWLWRSTIAAQQQAQYPESAMHGLGMRAGVTAVHVWHDYGTLAALGDWTSGWWLDGWSFAAGLGWMVVGLLRGNPEDGRRPRPGAPAPLRTDVWVSAIWLALLLGAPALMLPLDWDRYFLPGVMACTIVQATALGATAKLVWNWGFRQVRPEPE
jgi:hypothetical protein